MTRQPHVRRVHLPPEVPPRESPSEVLLGLAVLLLWGLAVVLWMAVGS